jgi:hypothetical protein
MTVKWNQLSRSAQKEAAQRLYNNFGVDLYARKSGRGYQLAYVNDGEQPPAGYEPVLHRHDEDFEAALFIR